MTTGSRGPQQYVGLGTDAGQNVIDDSADAVRQALVTQDGGRIDDDSANGLRTIQVGSTGGTVALAEITVQSSQAVTSSGVLNGATIVNPGARGIMLFLDVSSAASSTGQAPRLDILVQGQNPANSTFVNLPGASFTQVASTTVQQVLIIHPSVPNDSGTGFRRRPGPLPRSWRLQWDGSALDSGGGVPSTYEFTVGGIYIP